MVLTSPRRQPLPPFTAALPCRRPPVLHISHRAFYLPGTSQGTSAF